MSEDKHEKKHKPSLKRLKQLQEEGNFLRAREFYSGIKLIFAFIILYLMNNLLTERFMNNFIVTYNHFDRFIRDDTAITSLIKQIALANAVLFLPYFLGIILILFLSVHLFGGLHFPKKILQFKNERLSPVKNLSRLFSLQNTIEIAKSLLKLLLFFSLLLLFFKRHLLDVLNLSRITESDTTYQMLNLFKEFLFSMILGIWVIASVDAVFNHYSYHKKAMMSHQEMKEENKESEGSPEVKRKLRQAQQAIAFQRLRQDIPKASVIITNPSHYAVALRYVEKVDSAPVIVAKGCDHMAQQIRILASKHAIPIYQAPELARAIYYTGKIGGMIHPQLYMAVAIVLSYILQLKEFQLGRGHCPVPVEDLKIPEDFQFEQTDRRKT